MKTFKSLACALVLWAGLAGGASAQPSDLLRITLFGATPITYALFEGVGTPEAATFGLSSLGIPDGPYGGVLSTTIAPVFGAVALMEPVGHVPDPGDPVVLIGNRLVSDFVISFATATGIGVAFISDSDPNFLPWAGFLIGTPPVPLVLIDETGLFQDVTPFLMPVPPHYLIEVASDVPEPSALVLMLAGLGGLACARRRRAK